jgi:3'(2'), 5'-bisphosphate nucleotidase
MPDIQLTEQISAIAVKAGQQIIRIYEYTDFSAITEWKSDDSPLTLADKAAHEIISNELYSLDPAIPVLSEEGPQFDYAERKEWPEFWLVDPLDGTKEFINRNGQFTVNIALIREQRPVFGVIYVPVTGELYAGRVGEGAFKREADGTTTPIRVNGRKNRLVAVGSRSHAQPADAEVLRSYDVVETISIGSSLKFCLVAEGKADIYYRHGPTMEWDIAAGHAIVEAAGGKVMDFSRQAVFSYNKPSLLNGSFLCTGF